jgi:hypothetical protein
MKRTNSGLITARLLCKFSFRPFSVASIGLLQLVYPPGTINRAPSMMMTGGKKTMLSRNVLISSRKVACSIS